MKSQNWWIAMRGSRPSLGPLLPPGHHRKIDIVDAVVAHGILHRHVARFAEWADIRIQEHLAAFAQPGLAVLADGILELIHPVFRALWAPVSRYDPNVTADVAFVRLEAQCAAYCMDEPMGI